MGSSSCSCSQVIQGNGETTKTGEQLNALPHEGQHRASLQVKTGGFTLGRFAATNSGNIDDFFEFSQGHLGEGGFGAVRKATCKSTGACRAVKSIARSAVEDPQVLREEIEIMRLLDHPNIVMLFDTYEDACWVYLVMDICEGGELFQQIVDFGNFNESTVSLCARQMFLAVNYLHQNRIIHRDLKPENFLLATKSSLKSVTIKLIDFGFAKRFGAVAECSTMCGTIMYVAPEVLSSKPYNQKADIWSLGIIVYLMLSGEVPWGNAITNDDQIMKKIETHTMACSGQAWRSISQGCKNLVLSLLIREVDKRPEAATALNDKWMTQPANMSVNIGAEQLMSLKSFGKMHALKKAAIEVVATNLRDADIANLRQVFMSMDQNNDGTVSAKELKASLVNSGVKLPPRFENLVNECDTDGSGVLDFHEFLAATLDRKQYHQRDVVWAAFKRFDLDNSGYICKTELANVLTADVQQALDLQTNGTDIVDQIFAEEDLNQDGKIDFEEFFQMMHRRVRILPTDASKPTPCSTRGKKLKKAHG